MSTEDPTDPVANYGVSLIRTAVPALVGAIVAWLALRGLAIDDSVKTAAVTALTGVLTTAWYAVWRALEPKLPDWLTRIVLGSAKAPVAYATTSEAAKVAVVKKPVHRPAKPKE